jgi:hypothetical protein
MLAENLGMALRARSAFRLQIVASGGKGVQADAYDTLGFVRCLMLSKFRSTPGEPIPQSHWQDIPDMRKDNRRMFPHVAFNRHFVCLGVLYATVRTLFDSVHLPNQNDRFSYVHKFCLIFNSFLLRDWDLKTVEDEQRRITDASGEMLESVLSHLWECLLI